MLYRLRAAVTATITAVTAVRTELYDVSGMRPSEAEFRTYWATSSFCARLTDQPFCIASVLLLALHSKYCQEEKHTPSL